MMTRQRYDDKSTEFGLWLREQKELDSKLGFVATNIDYVWRNYRTKDFMIIEEKRYLGKSTFAQKQIFHLINWICKKHPKYKGFHYLKFEKTNPEDGRIFLDNQEISKEELIEFLKFNENWNSKTKSIIISKTKTNQEV